MGTYAYYTLTIIIEDEEKHKYSEKEIISQLRSEYWEAMEAIDEDGNTENEAKWYKSDDDMLEFSKKYPSIVFKLTQSPAQGDEDERDCECDIYYKNGEEFFDELEEFTTEIFIENIQSQRNIGQGATGTSPIKTKLDSLNTKIQRRVPFQAKLLHECWVCHCVGIKPGVLETRLGDYGMRDMLSRKYEVLVLNERGFCVSCEAKWSDCYEDLTVFSKKYPSILFKLTFSLANGDEDELGLGEFEFHFKNGEKFYVEDGVVVKSDISDNQPIFTEKPRPKKKNLSQDISPSPSKTDWEIWMEKSIAARNQR